MADVATLAAAATWVTWPGRTCAPPEAVATPVAVLFRNGAVETGFAGDFSWTHDVAPDGEDPEDIVAYRVRTEAAG